MAQLEKVAKENIETARQMLLAEIFREKTDDRYRKKQAVKQLLGALIAARSNGLGFDEMAAILDKAGVPIPVATLRTYFFELKTEDDIAKESRRHAEKITKISQAIDQRLMTAHQEHGTRVAVEFTEPERAEPRLFNGLAKPAPASPATHSKKPADAGKPEARLPLANAPASQPVAARPVLEPREEQRTEPLAGATIASATASLSPVKTSETTTEAMTLEAIEKASLETEQRTSLTEDVVVRNGQVFWQSGAPFIGTLNKKQLLLLRQVGKLIAPTAGKSSKDFVAMPTKL